MARVFSASAHKRREQAKANKEQRIIAAAIELFSQSGVYGVSIEQIADLADVSKGNLLYYFANKEQLYLATIKQILDVWFQPLAVFSEEQEPLVAIEAYIRVKLELSRDYPRESRLFCMEILQGAPLLLPELTQPLRDLVEKKVAVMKSWIDTGKMRPINPYHLLFSIWATTQHYADFAIQIDAVTGHSLQDPTFFDETLATLHQLFLDSLRVVDTKAIK